MANKSDLVRLANGRLGAPFRLGYDVVSRLEIAGATAWGRLRPTPTRSVPDLTVIAKAFERPYAERRMVASLRRVFDGPIVVADDSREPHLLNDLGVDVVVLPFDSGVANGRNAALARVATEFVMSVDDDFVFTPDLDLNRVVAYLRRNPDVDIVGGSVVSLPLWQTAEYSRAALFAYRGSPVKPLGEMVGGLPVRYKVPQFYVARTDRLRLVGWDGTLKRVDHNDFFTSAYGVLLTVHDPAFRCLHAQPKFDAHYQRFRKDTSADLRYLNLKWAQQ